MFASADAKSALFRDRYDIIKQRLLNNPLFRDASSFENENVREDQGKIFKLTPIPHISTTPPAHHVTLGMLTRMPDGRYHVEDPHASVPLEFPNKVARTPGVFTETAFVLVEGYWTGEVLRVETVGMPPGEGRAESDKSYKNIDFFGGPKSTESPERLLFLEKRLAEIHFVILSDLWLDQPKVLSHFRTLLSAYSTPDFTPPLAFLLCGPYSSRPYLLGASHFDAYREGFNTLADIIAEYPRLRESKFVFIPGPGDPWDTKVLPRARVPKTVTGRVEQKVPGAVFATNPCRMKYFTHEIVLYREDLATKLRRNCVVPPDEDEEPDAHVHLVQTVVAQSHLCPLPLEIRPVSWAYDAAMRVYPLPQTVILADRCDPYDVAESGSTFVNPGSFPTSGWSFVVYYPGSGRVQHSKIPN
ncbi:Pole2 protein [Gonapodya prolifera JEL478]|uniref:DNA polymerase epsilon subunit B n=1 Tax=Gonapodya prolifera (strain JEL478) TaxID=1344416 RepID=A0A139ACU5_GONPJ|nr:Pole2 protein [Gonapodya prolifera JEL478]|eukprot:KXS14233.1 Pole2 protein [Gonapodya prolifera JEL478]